MRRTENCTAGLKGLVASKAGLDTSHQQDTLQTDTEPTLFGIYVDALNGVADCTLQVHRQYKTEEWLVPSAGCTALSRLEKGAWQYSSMRPYWSTMSSYGTPNARANT